MMGEFGDVAVLLATFNGAEYLKEQLDSLFGQTYSDFRIAVHDDGSTDDTAAIISDYSKKYGGRIEVLQGPPLGNPKLNFIYMLDQVEADYYFFCDQDDVWTNDKIKKSLDLIKNYDIPSCVFSDMYVADSRLNILSDSFVNYLGRSGKNTAYTQILIDNPASGAAMCFNRKLRDIAVSNPDINYDNIPMHDAWVLEAAALFGTVKFIDEPLVYYRQTGSNVMGAHTESQAHKVARNIKEAGPGFLKRKRAFIDEARKFAAEVIKLDGIPRGRRKVLEDFVHIADRPKPARIYFYIKNNFSRARHSLWMWLWV